MVQVKATSKFLQLANKVMTSEALQELIDELTLYPEKGVVIPGTGGIRKLRWRTGKDNKGKSGGVRILYYYNKGIILIILISLFKKSDKENINAFEKIQLKKLLTEILRSYNHDQIRQSINQIS